MTLSGTVTIALLLICAGVLISAFELLVGGIIAVVGLGYGIVGIWTICRDPVQ